LIALDTVPVKSTAGSCEEESRVVLLMPRYPTIAGKLFGKLLNRSKYIKVKLDRIGSTTWNLIDGIKTVNEIGEELIKVFDKEAEPLYPRLVEFMNILLGNKFIKLVEPCEVKNVD